MSVDRHQIYYAVFKLEHAQVTYDKKALICSFFLTQILCLWQSRCTVVESMVTADILEELSLMAFSRLHVGFKERSKKFYAKLDHSKSFLGSHNSARALFLLDHLVG
jgi:hypothetical protein